MHERRPKNVFRFRRLKWGAPKKLEGLKAIGVDSGPAPRASGKGGALGLLLVCGIAGFAIVMSVLGWF